MSSRVALPVLMWSISAAGADESPADPPPVIELEGLTVTATKTERSTFEVPASVSIIGPERIESEEPQSIGDLLEELPNVEVISGPRRIGETANMRGFDEERTEVGLRFRTTDGLTTWGSYAEAFRAPGLTEAFAEDLHFRRIPGVFPDNFFVPNPDLKPETTSTLEAGNAHAFRRSLDRERSAAPGSCLFRSRRRGLHRSRGGYRRGDDPPRQIFRMPSSAVSRPSSDTTHPASSRP